MAAELIQMLAGLQGCPCAMGLGDPKIPGSYDNNPPASSTPITNSIIGSLVIGGVILWVVMSMGSKSKRPSTASVSMSGTRRRRKSSRRKSSRRSRRR